MSVKVFTSTYRKRLKIGSIRILKNWKLEEIYSEDEFSQLFREIVRLSAIRLAGH